MGFDTARFKPSSKEEGLMAADPETDMKSALYNSIYFGQFSRPGMGNKPMNTEVPTAGIIDMVAMPVVLTAIAMFFLLSK